MVKFEFYSIELVKHHNGFCYRLFGRDTERNKIDILVPAKDFYFYIPEAEEAKITFPCQKEKGFKSLFGEPVIKVSVDNYYDINGWKEKTGFKHIFTHTFEADIPAQIRFLIDKNIYTTLEIENGKIKPCECECVPRIMNIDIETKYIYGSNADMMLPIISISFWDSYLNKFFTLAYNDKGTTSHRIYTIKSEVMFKDKERTIPEEFACEEFIVKDEVELLEKFVAYVLEFDTDVFASWNVKFDMTYIYQRLKTLNLDETRLSPIGKVYSNLEPTNTGSYKNPSYKGKKERKINIKGRAIIDILSGYRRIRWKQIASFRLDDVSKTEFKTSKVSYKGSMENFWKEHFETFIKYNVRDVELCLSIDRKYSILDSLLNMRKIMGSGLSNVLQNSKMLDVYLLRYAKGKFVLPTQTFGKEHTKVEGGFVLDPVVGIHKNVIVLDLKSLYPAIMLSCNLSPEAIDINGEIQLGNGCRFNKKPGIITEILKDLLKRRDELRAQLKNPDIKNDIMKYTNIYRRQYYYKTVTNSMYGINLYPSFRLYNPAIGSSITWVGRFLSNKIRNYLQDELGYTVIYQDTDSAFVITKETSKEKVVEIGKTLEANINKKFSEWFVGMNNDTSYFSIKFEKLYSILYKGSEKKCYAGKICWEWESNKFLDVPEVELKGFGAVKTDRSIFSRNLQRKLFEMILNEDCSRDKALTFIYEEISKFYNMQYDYEYIGIPKAITKELDEYNITNPWITGVRWSMKNLESFQMSTKPFMLYITPSKEINTTSICFNNSSELPSNIKIDMKKMLDASAFQIVHNILPMIKINPEEIETYINNLVHNQKTLF